MARKPVAAGMFYEDDFSELDKQIITCFEEGTGSLPASKKDKDIKGIIAPHAGYAFSGKCQAWAYKEVGEAEMPSVYIVLGTNHSGIGGTCTLIEDFEMPFGKVKVDKEFAKSMIGKSINENKEAHSKEHSIEVQLPFLQFVNKDRLKEVMIVPILVRHGEDYERLAKDIVNTAKQLDRKIIVIASSDFTHYGISYAYIPFTDNVNKKVHEMDKKAIEFLEKMDAFSFIEYVNTNQMTVCGAYAIAAAVETCKLLGGEKGKLLRYYTSGDVTGDYGNSVGYGAILFK
ncbi:AmmeMemoRadiSam system protein B [Candidatus Woesearchaeota archaeon]|nr:AmmeMemoRadiSam system protein B [Candidatus Woesearchaeota archaeon]